jgi:UDP-glucose 4-epimerase
MSARYLITGGAGFIGSNIAEELLRRGESIRILDNFSTGRRENLEPLLEMQGLEVVEGDLRDRDAVNRAVEGVEFILHQAALPSVPRSVKDPVTSNDVNINGTLNILEAARAFGVKRVVYASSSSAYGNTPTLPKVETMPVMPLSPYAVTKYAAERYCQIYTKIYGLETVSLRYFNVFGPKQDPTSQYSAVIPKFITAIARGERPVIYGDGLQSRDFTFVQNNIEANLLACQAPAAAGEVFNIACGARYTLLDLVAAINRILGTSVEPLFEPERTGDVKHSMAGIDKAKELLGYTTSVEFFEGLERTVKFFL